MDHTSDTAHALPVLALRSAEMLRLVAMLSILRIDSVQDELEGIRENLVTLERLAERVSSTSTDVQVPCKESSSETSMGSEDGEPGVHC